MFTTNTSIFSITKNGEQQAAIARAYADIVKRRAQEVYESADAANKACDIAIAARKKANDAAYAAALEVKAAYAACGSI